MSAALPAATLAKPAAAQGLEARTAAKRRWVTVGVLSVLQAVENSEGGLINSLFPVIRADLGLTLGALGVLTSVGKFARMLMGPLWAMLGDRFGRKLILVATALWGVWMILAGFAQSYEQLLVLYAIGVLGTVAGEPISNGLVSDLFKPNERGKVYGSMRSITGFASIVATPLIGQLAGVPDNQGWRIGMFIMGGIGVVGGTLTWLFAEDPRKAGGVATAETADEPASIAGKEEGFKFAHVPRLMAIPTVALLAIQLVFITSLVLFAFQVVFLTDVRHYTTQVATIVTSVFFVGFTISSFVGGMLGDWFARRNPRTGRIMLMQVYLLAFAVLSFLAMQIDWPSRVLDYAIWLIFGLFGSIGFSGAVLPMVSTVVLPQYRGTAFALLFSFVQGALAAILSIFLGELAQNFGLRPVMLWMVTIPYAVNVVYWFMFYRIYPRDVERMQRELVAATAAAV
jgi:MFS family permease